jgi:hypothetical protein
VATTGVGVGLAQPGGEPGPRTQPPRVGEAVDVTDLGDEHRGQHPADPADLLDRLIPGITLQAHVDAGVGLDDLAVIQLDQISQRFDPVGVGVGEPQLIQPALPTGPPDPFGLGDHSFLAETLMHLRLQRGTQPGELVPVADLLTQLAHLRRCHPRLR